MGEKNTISPKKVQKSNRRIDVESVIQTIIEKNPSIRANELIKRLMKQTDLSHSTLYEHLGSMKIRGKLCREKGRYYLPDDFERLHIKVEENERRKDLENRLRGHNYQLAEVYEKWFEREPSSPITKTDAQAEYHISLAKIVYSTEKITITELEEPCYKNKRVVDEAIEHMNCYSEIWSLWKNAKVEVKQNLDHVETLWKELIEKITTRLSVECPQLDEWHGYGPRPDGYYSLRITFSHVWAYVKDNRCLADLRITLTDGKYIVGDCAESSNKDVMEQFIRVISDLVTDTKIQERMKVISSQKTRIEENLEKFRQALINVADDVKRKYERLKGFCATCKPWLNELGIGHIYS